MSVIKDQPTFTSQHWVQQLLDLIATVPFNELEALECIEAFGLQCQRDGQDPSFFRVADSFFNHSDLLPQKILIRARLSKAHHKSDPSVISASQINALLEAVWNLCPSLSIDSSWHYDSEEDDPDDAIGDYHASVLELACLYGFDEVIYSCLQRGASLQGSRDGHRTALMRAGEGRHLDLMTRLLDLGSDVNAQCRDGHTPLHYALSFGYLDVAELLLDRGAQMDIRNHEGLTAFHAAARFHDSSFLKLFMSHKADINAQDIHGQTACHYAAWHRQLLNLKCLVEAGADYQVKDYSGDTPLETAHKRGTQMIISYLTDVQAAHSEQHMLQSLIPTLDDSQDSVTPKKARL